MKARATTAPARASVLERLGTAPSSGKGSVHQRLGVPSTAPAVKDARELLNKRQQPIVDARQLLSRPSAQTIQAAPTRFTIKNDAAIKASAPAKAQTSQVKKSALTAADDKTSKKTPSPPPVKRAHRATVQTESVSFSSNNNRRKRANDDEETNEDRPEPAAKRSSNRKPIRDNDEPERSTKTSAQRTSDNHSRTGSSTILITNLQASVSEDDILELFSVVGHINEIQTLSHGCVQLTYADAEHAKQAVNKYHNRLLDGQSMYVSLQPQISYSTKSAKKAAASSSDESTSTSSSSKKITIDPAFIRQALFNPSNNESNPVRFQVKL